MPLLSFPNNMYNNDNDAEILSFSKIQKNKHLFFKDFFYYLSNSQIHHIVDIKLKDYLLIDDFEHLRVGAIIRCLWMDNDREVDLKSPCIILDIKMNNNGISCKCKSIGKKTTFFHVTASDNCRIFQKLTVDNLVLLRALDNI